MVSAAAFSLASCRSFNSILIYFVHMCAAAGTWKSEDNLTTCGSFLLLFKFQGSNNSGLQPWQQAPLWQSHLTGLVFKNNKCNKAYLDSSDFNLLYFSFPQVIIYICLICYSSPAFLEWGGAPC